MRGAFSSCFSSHFRLAILAIFLLGTLSQAAERLVLFGGGEPPEPAVRLFSKWAGGKGGKILVISWASENVLMGEKKFDDYFRPHFEGAIQQAPSFETIAEQKTVFLKQLSGATGVFFTGGDQNRIMDVLADLELFNALVATYKTGAVFGGTSAGTAIMSQIMFTGKEDLTVIDPLKTNVRAGLGLFRDVVLDQHFIKRQRQNRLFSVMLTSREPLGIGIDEEAAISVVDNTLLEVMGADQVMLVDNAEISGKLVVGLLKAGDKYNLATRSKVE